MRIYKLNFVYLYISDRLYFFIYIQTIISPRQSFLYILNCKTLCEGCINVNSINESLIIFLMFSSYDGHNDLLVV